MPVLAPSVSLGEAPDARHYPPRTQRRYGRIQHERPADESFHGLLSAGRVAAVESAPAMTAASDSISRITAGAFNVLPAVNDYQFVIDPHGFVYGAHQGLAPPGIFSPPPAADAFGLQIVIKFFSEGGVHFSKCDEALEKLYAFPVGAALIFLPAKILLTFSSARRYQSAHERQRWKSTQFGGVAPSCHPTTAVRRYDGKGGGQ